MEFLEKVGLRHPVSCEGESWFWFLFFADAGVAVRWTGTTPS